MRYTTSLAAQNVILGLKGFFFVCTIAEIARLLPVDSANVAKLL